MMRLAMITAAMGMSASGIAAPIVAPPAAVVHGHTVVHAPTGLTVRVPKTATFVGKDRFDIKGAADAEVEVFAEADRHKRLSKLYWIQFEHPWPDQKWRYDYSRDRREQHWGTTVWVNSGPGPTNGPDVGVDRAHVQALLERAGYIIPPGMMNVRMIQLLDDPKGTGHGGRELMFIYAEDLAKTGKTLAQWEKAPDAEWVPFDKPLVARAVKAFAVTRR